MAKKLPSRSTSVAYKYRSDTPIEFIYDILVNRRLYCADWTSLNDPMEGVFSYFAGDTVIKEAVDSIKFHKKQVKVCSLSLTATEPLMWSHYANGFRGVAIGLKLPAQSDIREVDYLKNGLELNPHSFTEPDEAAKKILSSKLYAWKHEKEIRILCPDDWYQLSTRAITQVVLGHRMCPLLKCGIAAVCHDKGIRVKEVVIEDCKVKSKPYVPA